MALHFDILELEFSKNGVARKSGMFLKVEGNDNMTNPNRESNQLIEDKSPYLQQHAYNPVDGYPWGEEAFARAKQENKPIFLSIGYSTCN